MSVSKSVTIIGAEGIEISGNHLARIFKVTNNAVLTLKDLTLCEGNADSNRLDAGAIIASNGNGSLATVKDIEDYEFVYSAYLSAVKNYLISAEKMADKNNASLINAGLKEYDELFNYDNYI